MAQRAARIQKARPMDEDTTLMASEVREGLTAPERWLPCKYFYDDRGSALFDAITTLPEYYQTRTEERLLETIADEIIDTIRPSELVELGSGVGRKIRLLLGSMQRAGLLRSCVLFDINESFLEQSADELARGYEGLSVRGIVGDFAKDLSAVGPCQRIATSPGDLGGGRMAIFLAGTVGNLHPSEVPPFLRRVRALLEPPDAFLLGVDLVKDPARLEAAYNDAAGVTAQFNLNILEVINQRLGADFDPTAFRHVAFYDRRRAWIEMRLRAARPSRVHIPAADLIVNFREGDEIRTEISCKYTRESLGAVLTDTGLEIARWFTDPESLFALALLTPRGSHALQARALHV
jgi:L-histidine Nalpha-methyltransferase